MPALTGYTTNIVGGRTQINQGNPDLRPEHSVSGDVGVEFLAASSLIDVTYFRTSVKDRVVSNVLLSNPPPPEPIVLTAVNSLGAHISGMDVDVAHRLSPMVSLFGNATHYFARREQLHHRRAEHSERCHRYRPRRPRSRHRRASSRFAARYVHGRQDQDFNVAGSPSITRTSWWSISRRRTGCTPSMPYTMNNLFDRYYYEKKWVPPPGCRRDAEISAG